MRSLRPLLAIAVLTLLWGANWPVMKIGVATLPPLWFRSVGLVLGTAFLGAILAARGVPLAVPRDARWRVVALSIPNIVVWYALVTVAIAMLPAGRAAILGFTMPGWAALFAVAFHRERLDAVSAAGVACAMGAVALLVADDWAAFVAAPLGVALMLAAAASWAVGTRWLSRASPAIDTLALTFWMMAAACPFVVGASALLEASRWRLPAGDEWLPVLYNAFLVLGVGNAIWFSVARRLPPTAAGLSSMLVPVVGVLSGTALLGEVPSAKEWGALALVCGAVAAGAVGRMRQSRDENTTKA